MPPPRGRCVAGIFKTKSNALHVRRSRRRRETLTQRAAPRACFGKQTPPPKRHKSHFRLNKLRTHTTRRARRLPSSDWQNSNKHHLLATSRRLLPSAANTHGHITGIFDLFLHMLIVCAYCVRARPRCVRRRGGCVARSTKPVWQEAVNKTSYACTQTINRSKTALSFSNVGPSAEAAKV